MQRRTVHDEVNRPDKPHAMSRQMAIFRQPGSAYGLDCVGFGKGKSPTAGSKSVGQLTSCCWKWMTAAGQKKSPGVGQTDPGLGTNNEDSMAQSIEKTEITKAHARKLTDRIKAAADQLWSLLLEAHEGGAWKALGYKTWEEYIGAEFDMSRRQSYNLLDQGRVTRAIEDASGVQRVAQISHRDAQAIKPVLPEVTQEIRQRVERGEEPAQATYEVIEAKRVERKVEPPAKPKLAAVPDPEPDDHDGPTLEELIDEIQAENKQLREEIAAAEADDLVAEAVKWRRIAENAQRQQGEAMDKASRAEKREAWNKRQLMRCGKAVGEEDPTKIAAKVEAMVRAAVAA